MWSDLRKLVLLVKAESSGKFLLSSSGRIMFRSLNLRSVSGCLFQWNSNWKFATITNDYQSLANHQSLPIIDQSTITNHWQFNNWTFEFLVLASPSEQFKMVKVFIKLNHLKNTQMTVIKPLLENSVLCIWTSFQVQLASESWWKYFVLPFSEFLSFLTQFQFKRSFIVISQYVAVAIFAVTTIKSFSKIWQIWDSVTYYNIRIRNWVLFWWAIKHKCSNS